MSFKIKKQVGPIVLMHIVFFTIAILLTLVIRNNSIILYLLMFEAFVYFLYLLSILSCSCKIKKNFLTYRCGIFFYKINLDEITRIEQCRNLFFSLAPSKERIRIIYGKNGRVKMRYISVEDNDNFIQFIKHKGYEKL